jgi:dienelactone hydrolase
LADLLDKSRPRPAVNIVGHLFLPSGVTGGQRRPAVVLMHGSGGVYPELLAFWPKMLNELGIAAFVVDSFSPRGVTSTVDDQSQVPFSADLADASAALGLLASHPLIDKDRIAIMGFSRGGTSTWRTASTRLIERAAPAGLRFAAHVPVYSGGCAGLLSFSVKPGVFDPAPMLWVHGDADDYTYANDCRDYAQRINAAGTPSEFLVLPGARHKFDANEQRRIHLRTAQKTREGCPLEYDIMAFTARDRRTGEALSQEKAQALNKELCATTGATVEGSQSARTTAAKAIGEFLKRVLKV